MDTKLLLGEFKNLCPPDSRLSSIWESHVKALDTDGSGGGPLDLWQEKSSTITIFRRVGNPG